MRLSTDILIGEQELGLRVEGMAQAIAADSRVDSSLSVVAVMDGAFMFGSDLVRRLPMPVRLSFLPLRSVTRGGDPASVRFADDFPIRGADVLLVEDILDTGQTLRALIDVISAMEPRSLRVAVLLDKPSGREVEVVPDYVGFQVEDRWVVGYGLDYDGLYRNLPYITYVQPE